MSAVAETQSTVANPKTMPGALDIDFSKVRRKIRSVPGSPKQNSPTNSSNPKSGGGWSKFGKFGKKSTPNINVSQSQTLPHLALNSYDLASSLSDDDSTAHIGKIVGENSTTATFSRRRKHADFWHSSTSDLLNFGGRPKVCVILNDDQLLLVRIT